MTDSLFYRLGAGVASVYSQTRYVTLDDDLIAAGPFTKDNPRPRDEHASGILFNPQAPDAFDSIYRKVAAANPEATKSGDEVVVVGKGAYRGVVTEFREFLRDNGLKIRTPAVVTSPLAVDSRVKPGDYND